MASSEAMDDSFRVRVEKIFGSLKSSSQQPSSLQSTLWSLNDDEVEKREWRRDAGASDRDDVPCSSSFNELKRDRKKNFRRALAEDLDELDGDDDEESNTLRRRRVGSDGVDEWDIRSSIGLDRTLDNEEEEDEYDKVASGRENAGERLYMKNVTNQESYLNIHNVLPKSLRGTKDPRANLMKAKIRLQEDEAEAPEQNSHLYCDTEVKELCVKPSHENGSQVRSILKRKDNSSDSKPHKRVTFDPVCDTVCEEEATKKVENISMGSSSLNSVRSDGEYMSSQNAYGVPDYLRNPSKYTCYSFNSSSEVEEKSNTQACMDFLELVKGLKSTGSESELKDATTDLHKPVTFIPRKKVGHANAINYCSKVDKHDGNRSSQQNVLPVGIAAGDSQELEAGVMEEDDPETNAMIKSDSSQKANRIYRTKSSSDE
ncbi:hypothetical protein JCGZ_23100 [Jatropha curcas]|uniref:Uncharacterized protein n=1 Tax=Jatropha curcas TaxID=180498 RepID=A0A067JHE4_JATCU|nr:uncharacterized protein LOC105647308 [Jatropha curcas]KDP23267.1 hypothetical protein JCGZ_23100 [Jatropha curcas]